MNREIESTPQSHVWPWARVVGSLLLGVVAQLVTELSLVADLAVLLTTLSLPRSFVRRVPVWLTLAVAAMLGVVATVRFVIGAAVPGLVKGGNNATELRALSRLREVLFAEDAARKLAFVDPDRDGIGSAALIGELSGALPLRGGAPLPEPPLNSEFRRQVETKYGPATPLGGYLFMVCLPTRDGQLSARPGSPWDEERAERNYVGYAWPIDDAHGVSRVFFLDAHETILVFDNRRGAELTFAGPYFPPPCDAALGTAAERARAGWKPWRDKKPRTDLPGDR